jgi:hypothetical protein
MPVRVNIPIRLRVDPSALIERQADVEEALAAAVGRALANSRDVVLEKRGGYVGVRVHPPEFNWCGDGLMAISSSLQTKTEQYIIDSLQRITKQENIFELASLSAEVAQPLVDNTTEKVDWDRVSLFLGLYEIPSYGKAGKKQTVKLTSKEGNKSETPMIAVDLWQKLPDGWWKNAATMKATVTRAVMQWGNQEGGDYSGVIWRSSRGFVIQCTSRSTKKIQLIEVGTPSKYLIKNIVDNRGKSKDDFVKVTSIPAPGIPIILKFCADVKTDSQRLDFVRSTYTDGIRQMIREKAPKLGNTPQVDFEVQLNEKVEKEIEKRVQEIIHWPTIYTLNIAGSISYIGVTESLFQLDGEAHLLPLGTIQEQISSQNQDDEESDPTQGEDTEATLSQSEKGGENVAKGMGVSRERGNKETKDTTLGSNTKGKLGAEKGEENSQPQDSFIYTEQSENAASSNQFFPVSRRISFRDALVCESFQGEPSIVELGSDGEYLKQLMNEIAHKLQTPSCEFAGQFCLNAAATLGGRAVDIGSYAPSEEGFTRQVMVNTGNLGLLQFVPTASPGIQLIRHLASITPLISHFSVQIDNIYSKSEHRNKIRGFRQNDPTGWHLDFLKELTPLMKEAVGYLFVMTCRILLLQLLRVSKAAIQKRLDNFKANAPLFEQLVITQLADVDELIQLRDWLKTFPQVTQVQDQDIVTKVTGGSAIAPEMEWLDATRLVTDAIATKPNNPQSDRSTGNPGEIVTKGGVSRIRDRHNRLWTLVDLESTIATRRGLAEDIDPIVKHMTDIPEVMERFRMAEQFGFRSEAIQMELANILNKMKADNEEITSKVTDDWRYAFKASRIQESLPAASIPGTEFALQGIHLQAHEQIGEFFQGSSYYSAGINSLFNARLGQEFLSSFFEFTGLVLLAIICPVVGIGLAAYQYNLALEKETLYDALIDPESLINHAEVEAELFAAKLGLALAFIPEVGSILKVGSYGIKAVSKAGLAGGSRLVGRYVARRVTTEMLEALSRNLAIAFAKEAVTNLVMDEIMQVVMEPIIQSIEREASITGSVGGSQGAEMVRQMLAAEQQAIESPSVLDSSKNDPDRREN